VVSKTLVFVSSTSRLAEERGQLRDKLPRVYEVYVYEDDRARTADPEEHCRKMIAQSDVFLGILGTDYGSCYPGEQRSIVEWEFDTASAREELEVLTFVKTQGPGETSEPLQEAFIRRVTSFRGGHWCKQFATAEELVERVRSSLEQWLAEFRIQMQQKRHRLLPEIILLTAIAALCVLGLLASVFVFPPSAVPRNIIVGLSICTAAAVAGACVLVWREIGGPYGN
jgi:hypothetical protein